MPLIKCKYVVIDGMPILLVEDLVPIVFEKPQRDVGVPALTVQLCHPFHALAVIADGIVIPPR